MFAHSYSENSHEIAYENLIRWRRIDHTQGGGGHGVSPPPMAAW